MRSPAGSAGKTKLRRAVRKAQVVRHVTTSSVKPSGPQLPPRAITAASQASRQAGGRDGGILRSGPAIGSDGRGVTISAEASTATPANGKKMRRQSSTDRRRRLSTTGLGLSANIASNANSKFRQATVQARKWFDELDADGSGSLDKEEFVHLAQRLGLQSTSRQKLAKEFLSVDTQGEGEIGFPQFCNWWTRFKEQKRQGVRTQVRELFEKLDVDKDGSLGKQEISRLVQKSSGLANLVPPFDLESDWELMRHHEPAHLSIDPDDDLHGGEGGAANEPAVSFGAFESWWKERIGFDDVGIPVLPEFLVTKIHELDSRDAAYMRTSADTQPGGTSVGGARRRRTGRELWRWLRPRLRLMVEMTNAWGDVHKLYESRQDSLFGNGENTELGAWIRDPDSVATMCWEGAQIFFLLYVSVVVPMRACFGIELEVGSLPFWFDVLVDLYFIFDVVANFRTAYHLPSGVLEGRPKMIALNYLRSWFLVDFLSCLPINYVFLLLEALSDKTDESNRAAGLKAVKVVRLVRLTKMLRIARLKRMLQKYQEKMNFSKGLTIVFLLFSILFTAHMLCCIWYLVGTETQIYPNGVRVLGWVQQEPWGRDGLSMGEAVRDSLQALNTGQAAAAAAAAPADGDGDGSGAGGPGPAVAGHGQGPHGRRALAGASTAGEIGGPYFYPEPGWAMGGAAEGQNEAALVAALGGKETPEAWLEISHATRYVTSMYYVFNAIENGSTDLERLTAVFGELVLGLVFGSLAGLMSNLMSGMNGKDQQYMENMRALRQWLDEKKIPRTLKPRVLKYFSHVWGEANHNVGATLLEEMPPAMAGEISRHVYYKVIAAVPLFRGLSSDILIRLCQACVPMIAVRKQMIMREGDVGEEMYMLMEGELEVLTGLGKATERRLGYLSAGSFFGEIPLLANHSGAEVRTRTVRAVTDCELCFLTKSEVQKWRGRYPELDLRFRRFSRVGERSNTLRRMLSKLRKGAAASSAAATYGNDGHDVLAGLELATDPIRALSPPATRTGRSLSPTGRTAEELQEAEERARQEADERQQRQTEALREHHSEVAKGVEDANQALTTVVCDLLWKVDELLQRDNERNRQLQQLLSVQEEQTKKKEEEVEPSGWTSLLP